MESIRKIAVIDDQEEILSLCRRILVKEGYEVFTSKDPQEVLSIISKEKFDVVLTDMIMPGINGLELIKEIKKREPLTAVVLMTGQGDVETAVKAMRYGAFDYILKPFDKNKLTTLMKLCLLHQQTDTSLLDSILELNRKILFTNKPEPEHDILNYILSKAVKLCNADNGVIMLYDTEKDRLYPGAISESKYAYKLSEILSCYNKKKEIGNSSAAVLLNIENIHNPILNSVIPEFQDLPIIRFPLLFDEVLLGILCVFREFDKAEFTLNELNILNAFSMNAAIAIMECRHSSDLRTLNKLKVDLIANVSHELRIPLTALGGALELLITEYSKYQDDKDETLIKILGILQNNHTRLSSLVNNLLCYSRLIHNTYKVDLQEFCIKELIDESVQLMLPIIEKKQQKLLVKLNDPIINIKMIGDKSSLLQVLTNLIDNAVKYSEKNKSIGINVDIVEGNVLITVWDQGIGIAQAEHSKIFEYFYRVDDSLTSMQSGVGIGLSLTKDIVRAHHGEIRVISSLNNGTQIIVILPLRQGVKKTGG
ncbi:MAG: response regulator [Elusimicrobiota bacterium]